MMKKVFIGNNAIFKLAIPLLFGVVGFLLNFLPVVIYDLPLGDMGARLTAFLIFAAFGLFISSYYNRHDPLTELYNRSYFYNTCKRLATAGNLPISIVMGDINGLRVINETLGYAAGDKILKKAAGIIKRQCKKNDLAARWDGDEFIVFLPKTDAYKAERFIDGIHRECVSAGTEKGAISLTLGCYTQLSVIEDIKTVLANAENAFYEQKAIERPGINLSTQTIIKTLYEKSIREEEHSKRVSYLCSKIGRAMGLSERKVCELENVGLLHDIGKIIIKEDVLEKSGGLMPEDWNEIKRHPEVGYRIMNGLDGMNTLASIIYSHHERYDGFGYPRGLRGDEIPLEARVIAIADSYDAMTSSRPYRKPMDKYYAVKEIIDNSGSQFDERIARIFVEEVLGENWDKPAADATPHYEP